jgi:hypothetical protein
VVVLDQDFYDNKQHGSRIFKPVFRLVGWADGEGNLEAAEEKVVKIPEPPAKPAKPPLETPAAGQRRRPGR